MHLLLCEIGSGVGEGQTEWTSRKGERSHRRLLAGTFPGRPVDIFSNTLDLYSSHFKKLTRNDQGS